MKLRQNTACWNSFRTVWLTNLTRTTETMWAEISFEHTYTAICFTFRKETCQTKNNNKKRRYRYWFSKFSQLSEHFSALWSRVYVSTLPHACSAAWPLPERRQKEDGHNEKTKTSGCPCVEVMLRCLCIPLYSLFALNDQRRSIRDKCDTDERSKPQTQVDRRRSWNNLNSVHMYVVYAVHVCISQVKQM